MYLDYSVEILGKRDQNSNDEARLISAPKSSNRFPPPVPLTLNHTTAPKSLNSDIKIGKIKETTNFDDKSHGNPDSGLPLIPQRKDEEKPFHFISKLAIGRYPLANTNLFLNYLLSHPPPGPFLLVLFWRRNFLGKSPFIIPEFEDLRSFSSVPSYPNSAFFILWLLVHFSSRLFSKFRPFDPLL